MNKLLKQQQQQQPRVTYTSLCSHSDDKGRRICRGTADVNSLSTSQRHCFRVERFTFFLT